MVTLAALALGYIVGGALLIEGSVRVPGIVRTMYDAIGHLFFNNPPTPEIYTLSLHDALPIYRKTMLSIPIFTPGSEDHLIGVLSADSDAHLRFEEDIEEIEKAFDIGQQWAVVFTAVLG